jgi:hypothetical protein
MKRLKKGSVLAVILALMVTLTAFVLPTAYVSAEGELVNVTFVVTGSRILTKKTDHATAYDDGAWVDEAVTGLDSNKTVADVTLQQLDNEVAGRSVTIISSAYGSFLSSITVDGKTNTGGVTNGRNSYWQLLINGTPANMGMDAITVNEGDRIEWKFINDPTFPLSVEQETADPALTLSPTPDYWTSFASSSLHNAAKTIKGTLENNFKLLWSKPYGEKSEWGGLRYEVGLYDHWRPSLFCCRR